MPEGSGRTYGVGLKDLDYVHNILFFFFSLLIPKILFLLDLESRARKEWIG